MQILYLTWPNFRWRRKDTKFVVMLCFIFSITAGSKHKSKHENMRH